MKRFLSFACLIATLGGCAIVPLGYPVHEHGYQEYRGDGYDGNRWHGHGGGQGWRYGGYHH